MNHAEEFSPWAEAIRLQKYAHTKNDGTKETWAETSYRVASNVLGALKVKQRVIDRMAELIYRRLFIPGGRYLYATGRPLHQTQNCVLNRCEDSREGWADHLYKATMSLTTGAGLGVVYSDIREEGALIQGSGGYATGPIPLMMATNEVGRGIKQGGSRRSALWAGLHWWHPDIDKFIESKDWPKHIRQAKEADYNAYAPMDGTNVSVILDTVFFNCLHTKEDFIHVNPNNKRAYLASYNRAIAIYKNVVKHMLKTGEPGFSVDHGENEGENCRNACTEVTSYDDSDICNLGSINLARINSLDEMDEVVDLGTLFLLAGTVYSDLPYAKIEETRTKNRRLGLGLMGVHEFLLKWGKRYEQDELLRWYLAEYTNSDCCAYVYAKMHGLSVPVKTRAIAPTGSIGILAETTTGIEPLFCVAYKRRYLDGDTWKYQYVVDPAAKRLIDSGVKPENIEDAYTLAADVERRLDFQAWIQTYVDHAISSTINLPQWGSELNNESRIPEFEALLLKYLPKLRGITVYPDGARGGQPLNPVKLSTALKHPGEVFYEQADICDITKGGSCGA